MSGMGSGPFVFSAFKVRSKGAVNDFFPVPLQAEHFTIGIFTVARLSVDIQKSNGLQLPLLI